MIFIICLYQFIIKHNKRVELVRNDQEIVYNGQVLANVHMTKYLGAKLMSHGGSWGMMRR